jgi:hypothetical protein
VLLAVMEMQLDIEVARCLGFGSLLAYRWACCSTVIRGLHLELPAGAVGRSKLELVAVELEDKVMRRTRIRIVVRHVHLLVGMAGKWYLESENGVLLGNRW